MWPFAAAPAAPAAPAPAPAVSTVPAAFASLLAPLVLPMLYLAVPHARRPWLRGARGPLVALVAALALCGDARARIAASGNVAAAYTAGLMQAWVVLWSAVLLLWMDPQAEAERVERRKKSTGAEGPAAAAVVVVGDAPDEDVAKSLMEGYEYYWQAYPAEAPFWTRLEWCMNLVTSWRGTGWNWGVPILPRFARAEKPLTGSMVDLHSIPVVTRQGYRRYRTSREWARAKIVPLLLEYLAIDLLSVFMRKDPYFLLGPEQTAQVMAVAPWTLPPFLAALPPSVLFVERGLLCFGAIVIAIDAIMTLSQLFTRFVLGPRVLGTRAELWHYPSIYGGWTACVLDKGMAGFWGGWWHQTFRVGFSAPGAWLGRRGYIDPPAAAGRALAALLAFLQSGAMHALGSASCRLPSKPHLSAAFFLLCWAGIVVQAALGALLRRAARGAPPARRAVRAANLGFTFVWLVYFQHLFNDDLARVGIFKLDPLPLSPARAAGLGRPGDPWLRWD